MNRIKRIMSGFVLLVMVLSMLVGVSPVYAVDPPQEIVSMATETSETFQLSSGSYRLEAYTIAIHYKDNYTSTTEEWKDIDLTPGANGSITKAPYTLTIANGIYTMTDKKTGSVATIKPTKIGEKIASTADFKVDAFNTGVRLQRTILSDKDAMTGEFDLSVTGTGITVTSKAKDADGKDIPLIVSKVGGKLTESIDISKVDIKTIKYPVTIDPELTVNTSGTSDGYAFYYGPDTWHNAQGGNGTGVSNTEMEFYPVYFFGGGAPNWWNLNRGFFFFNTTALPDATTVTSATFSIYGSSKFDDLNITPDMGLYNATSTNTAVVAADYQTAGTTDYSATTITYAGFNTGGYNNFVLNAAGIAEINPTGWSHFCIRNHTYDAHDVEPTNTWADSGLLVKAAEAAGKEPKLAIDYTGVGSPIVTTIGATELTTISATLLGSLTSLGTYSTVDVYFQYSLTGAFAGEELVTSPETKTAIGSFSKQILNLTSYETYYYRARADFDSSSHVNGAILTFDTMATQSPTTPTAPTNTTPTPYPGQTYVIRLGTTVAGWLDSAGSLFGTDGKGFGGGLTFVIIMVIWLWLSSKGYPVAGGALTLPIQLGSAYIGLWEWAFVGVIVFLLATVWIYKTWFEK